MHLFPSCDLLDSCSALFVFESGLLCVLAMLAATFGDQLGNTPTSCRVGKGQHTLLRRPPAQSLCPRYFLCGNAVKPFSYHSQSISEASNSGSVDKAEQPQQEWSHGTRGGKAGRVKLSSFASLPSFLFSFSKCNLYVQLPT